MSLAATLAWVAAAMVDAREPWWIIGSAAVRLHGAETDVADVDLLAGEADARALLARYDRVAHPAPSPLFRSRVFGCLDQAGMRVDVMAGFEIRSGSGWCPVRPRTRVALGGAFVPDATELLAILALFGRDKDRARALSLAQATGIAEGMTHDPASRADAVATGR